MDFISVTTVSDETFTVRIRNVCYFMYFCKCSQICVSATVPIDLEASNMTWSPPMLHLSLHLKVSWEVVFSMSYLSIVRYFKSTSMIWFCSGTCRHVQIPRLSMHWNEQKNGEQLWCLSPWWKTNRNIPTSSRSPAEAHWNGLKPMDKLRADDDQISVWVLWWIQGRKVEWFPTNST